MLEKDRAKLRAMLKSPAANLAADGEYAKAVKEVEAIDGGHSEVMKSQQARDVLKFKHGPNKWIKLYRQEQQERAQERATSTIAEANTEAQIATNATNATNATTSSTRKSDEAPAKAPDSKSKLHAIEEELSKVKNNPKLKTEVKKLVQAELMAKFV